jgi:hypothetical protein
MVYNILKAYLYEYVKIFALLAVLGIASSSGKFDNFAETSNFLSVIGRLSTSHGIQKKSTKCTYGT